MKLWVMLICTALLASGCTEGSSSTSDSSTWSRVPHDEVVFGGEGRQVMESVTAGGPGLVAVGRVGPGGDVDAAVWTSPDGLTWSRVPHDEAVLGGEGRQAMESVTAGGPGLVAVGRAGPVADFDAAVWTSPDGITWSRVPHDEEVFGGEGRQVMLSVTAGGPGLVAVGYVRLNGDLDAAVWISPDGLTWSRVPHDEVVFSGKGRQQMFGVTVGGPGLVAVGEDRSDASVWTSPDGITWSRVPDDEEVFGGEDRQEMFGVTVGGPGLVAVGRDRVSDAAVWTSPDGITWSRVPDDEGVLGGEGFQYMNSVTAGGPGLVAVGLAGPGSRGLLGSGIDEDAAVWTSPDGITWSRIPHDEAVLGGEIRQEMFDVTVGGPGLVAIGSDESRGNLDAAVWTAATED